MIDVRKGILYMDVDGVLADMVGALVARVNAKNGTNWKPDDVESWDWEPIIKPPDIWWNYTGDAKFWGTLPVLPLAQDLMRAALGTGMPVAFLSSLAIKTHGIWDARRNWLAKHFTSPQMADPGTYLIAAERKDLVVHDGDLLIDDSEDNVIDVRRRGADGWCVARSYNVGAPNRMDVHEIIDNLAELGSSRRDAESDR